MEYGNLGGHFDGNKGVMSKFTGMTHEVISNNFEREVTSFKYLLHQNNQLRWVHYTGGSFYYSYRTDMNTGEVGTTSLSMAGGAGGIQVYGKGDDSLMQYFASGGTDWFLINASDGTVSRLADLPTRNIWAGAYFYHNGAVYSCRALSNEYQFDLHKYVEATGAWSYLGTHSLTWGNCNTIWANVIGDTVYIFCSNNKGNVAVVHYSLSSGAFSAGPTFTSTKLFEVNVACSRTFATSKYLYLFCFSDIFRYNPQTQELRRVKGTPQWQSTVMTEKAIYATYSNIPGFDKITFTE